MLDAGKMRFRALVQRPSETKGPSGQPVDAWVTVANRRAARVPSAGSEQLVAQQRVGRVPVEWRLRYVDGVTPAMRLVSGGKVYEITSAIDPDGTKTELRVSSLELIGEKP